MKPEVLGSGLACGPGMVAAYSQRQLAARGAQDTLLQMHPKGKALILIALWVFVCGIQIELHPECKLAPGKGHLH